MFEAEKLKPKVSPVEQSVEEIAAILKSVEEQLDQAPEVTEETVDPNAEENLHPLATLEEIQVANDKTNHGLKEMEG
jgi:hypothetical protein